MLEGDKIKVAQGENPCYLLLDQANRHGLIAGASGTGKTVTMKVLAEGFAQAGVPVFMADVKGDVTGMAQPGDDTEKVRERAAALGADGWEPRGCDVRLWDMLGGDGVPVRITISDMGPDLLARLLGLTTQALRFYEQEGVVTPKKSENGTRYYDEDQLILLLSFKKYRQADFSVQDIVTHFFKEDDLSGLRGQTLARRDMLLEQSALLRRRAEAFGAFEARLAYAQRHLDEPTLCERPLLHMLSPSLSELDFVDFKSRDSLEQFIAAMPDTRISFARKSAPGSERDFRLCANDEACAAWNLPLAHTRPLTPARCIRLIHRFACQPWDDEAMPELTAIGRKAGYAIAEDQPYLGLHLATENHQEHIYFYATFYLPVLEG